MYACIPEIGSGFFEGVNALSDQACIFSDPPPCPTISILTLANATRSKGERGSRRTTCPAR
jgi:hypothetical protein